MYTRWEKLLQNNALLRPTLVSAAPIPRHHGESTMATVRTVPGIVAPVLWQTGQVAGLMLTVALLTGLWFEPEPTLRVLWYAIIPVLPAVFLIQPGIWRNVCPLVTLNTLPGTRSR